jgi:quercetin dioxygenase-like cupin family protein
MIEICHIFKQDELKGKARLIAKIKLEPGCSIGPHEHVDEEEIFYILKGTATADDNGQTSRLNPGDALLTGGGAMHSISNNGNETLELMAVIILY